MHGGLTPSGIAAGNFKHGLYSKSLPTRLLSTYQERLADSSLLELKDQVSLIDARTVELLKKLDTGESNQAWGLLKEHITTAREAALAGDAKTLFASLLVMQNLIDAGGRDAEIWSEIYSTVGIRKSLAETERRLLMQSDQILTMEQAMLLVTSIVSIVRTYVHDVDTLVKISTGIDRVFLVKNDIS